MRKEWRGRLQAMKDEWKGRLTGKGGGHASGAGGAAPEREAAEAKSAPRSAVGSAKGAAPGRPPRGPVIGMPSAASAIDGKRSMESEELLRQIKVAHTEWVCAQQRLDYVVSDDEIDYAIFALETAEKRYGILIKQAKAMRLTASGFLSTPPRLPTQPKRSVGG